MVRVVFRYADEMSNWEWRTQECCVSSVEDCIKFYGLGVDCEYEIVKVEKI